MNSKMLMLGILLLAGLSFANGGPQNWMQTAQARYNCNLMYVGGPGHSLMNIAQTDLSACGYFDCGEMQTDIMFLIQILFSRDSMCENAGCYIDPGPDPEGFRSNMLAYSARSAHFKSFFLSGMRAYLADADAGEKAYAYEVMQSGLSSYRECLALNRYCYCP